MQYVETILGYLLGEISEELATELVEEGSISHCKACSVIGKEIKIYHVTNANKVQQIAFRLNDLKIGTSVVITGGEFEGLEGTIRYVIEGGKFGVRLATGLTEIELTQFERRKIKEGDKVEIISKEHTTQRWGWNKHMDEIMFTPVPVQRRLQNRLRIEGWTVHVKDVKLITNFSRARIKRPATIIMNDDWFVVRRGRREQRYPNDDSWKAQKLKDIARLGVLIRQARGTRVLEVGPND